MQLTRSRRSSPRARACKRCVEDPQGVRLAIELHQGIDAGVCASSRSRPSPLLMAVAVEYRQRSGGIMLAICGRCRAWPRSCDSASGLASPLWLGAGRCDRRAGPKGGALAVGRGDAARSGR